MEGKFSSCQSVVLPLEGCIDFLSLLLSVEEFNSLEGNSDFNVDLSVE